MSTEESDASLVGLDWETWQRVTQTCGLTAASGTSYDAAAMPSQSKLIRFQFYNFILFAFMIDFIAKFYVNPKNTIEYERLRRSCVN